jgi:hypothetical protein
VDNNFTEVQLMVAIEKMAVRRQNVFLNVVSFLFIS